MGLEARTEYRLRYLKSDEWQAFRVKCLLHWGSKCFVCGKEDFHNDIHHVFYGRSWKTVHPNQTRVLCRTCHKEIHDLMKLEPAPKRQCEKHKQFGELANVLMARKGILSSSYYRAQEVREHRLTTTVY